MAIQIAIIDCGGLSITHLSVYHTEDIIQKYGKSKSMNDGRL